MQLQVIGPLPFARDERYQSPPRIATLFPRHSLLWTQAPEIHALQRLGFVEHLNAQRTTAALPPLTSDEEEAIPAVDLIFESGQVLIRPDPARMDLAFAADELLQLLVSKRRVKFLSAANPRVNEAIRNRGEYWRLSALPKTLEGKRHLVDGSKVAIKGLPIYFYNPLTGTRWLTCQEFCQLAALNDGTLNLHLVEIAENATRVNRLGRPELNFFAADPERFGPRDFAPVIDPAHDAGQCRRVFVELRERFRAAVPPELAHDDINNRLWSERILSALFLDGNDADTEDLLGGLSAEFFLQVAWLPGGRFEDGEFLVDAVFDEAASQPGDAELQRLCDPRAKEIIMNFTRDYGDLEYINLGCIPESLSLDRPQKEGRRGVYLAEFQVRNQPLPIRRFLRLQKWGVWEHLDEGKDLLESILESDEYTDYSLDRRLGCRQLGMNLCRRVLIRRLNEIYRGSNLRHRGQLIRTPYFEREYLAGIATDKLPADRYARPGYAASLATLLGHAAASSMVVGRSLENARPAFDDGDEVVLESRDGLPSDILVADHSGAFTEYTLPLESFATHYARPVNRREPLVPDPVDFAERFLASFHEQLVHVQDEYRKRRRAFDNLFKHCRYDPAGSFAYRWECVLRRLDQSDAAAITSAVRRQIHVLNPPGRL